jgi:hypothetical protein
MARWWRGCEGGGDAVGSQRWETRHRWADWAEKAAGPNWDAEPTCFFGLKWEREKKKTGCRIEFQIYSKIRDLNIFKPNFN